MTGWVELELNALLTYRELPAWQGMDSNRWHLLSTRTTHDSLDEDPARRTRKYFLNKRVVFVIF